MDSSKLEAIYPLTFMQQTLLIHSLSEGKDQGFLQVQCSLEGTLDLELLKEAWSQIINQHAAFRTSIHWEEIEQPVQVIHSEASLDWSYHNWEKAKAGIDKRIDNLKELDSQKGFDFTKAPISRVAIIKLASNKHILIWTCHHILFDGWSGGVVFKDLFDCYHNLCNNTVYQPKPVPSYKTYQDWIKGFDLEPAISFWKHRFEGFQVPKIAAPDTTEPKVKDDYHNHFVHLSPETSSLLHSYLKDQRLTLNTFLVALWGTLLSKLYKSDDVTFGITVSGRSGQLSGVDRLVGLLMNVLPVRLQIPKEKPLTEFLSEIQQLQAATSKYEHITQEQIASWIEWPDHIPLFNSLVVVQNLIWKEVTSGQLVVKEAKGGLTTTYPLTLVVSPGDALTFNIRYHKSKLNEETAVWLANSLTKIIEGALGKQISAVGDMFPLLEEPPKINATVNGAVTKTKKLNSKSLFDYKAPTNSNELELTKIWEALFGKAPIGINENFFQMGGTSMMAFQLLSRIERTLGNRVSPAVLLQNPTIESMASTWTKDVSVDRWSSLVPMRAAGTKPPLFVIHGGGGHVFFYQPLVQHLDPDQPVYALQPLGLDGEDEKHESIESMAAHYLKVILQVCPEGPFTVMGSCFSDPVCVEISKLVSQERREELTVIIADSAPIHIFEYEPILTPIEVRKARFRDRFRHNPVSAIKKMLKDRIRRQLKGPLEKWEFLSARYSWGTRDRKLYALQENLMKIYYQYDWAPFKGKITLIQTSQNVARVNNHDDDIWKRLAIDGVNLLVAEGSHRSRFEEPDVIALARCLQGYMDKYVEHQDSRESRESLLNER